MKHKNHTLLSKKETNRLKHVGGQKSHKSNKKQLVRMQRNEAILQSTAQ